MKTWREGLASCSSVCLRCALGLSLLSAVADHFGWCGVLGQPHVSWGNFARFGAFTGHLNWFVPHAMVFAPAVLAPLIMCMRASVDCAASNALNPRNSRRAS
jgi:hypothetical protein